MERRDPPGGSHPVLYVDDEEANRVVFASTVGRHFETVLASSGAEALNVLTSRPIDVLITDNRMPRMNGIELCEHVRVRYPDVQRVLITAYSDLQTVSEAINRGGVSHYVTKPWKLPEVLTVLREASSAARVQRMTRELQSAMLAKERMGALAAARGQVLHDLANAASLVSTSCQALQSLAVDGRPHLPEAIADGFDAELHDLRRAATYLEALHTRVRGLNRAGEPEAVSNDLDELFATAVAVARGHLPHAARVEIECPPRTTAWCDPTDLGRILVNLVSNAAQALTDAGTPNACIRIGAEASDGWVRISVADNGPGVPVPLRSRVFETHFTTRRDTGGSGLGLAISRQLALDNAGTLEIADSERGARFVLTLPSRAETPVRLAHRG
jgi:signal transduction histidine kinase